MLVVVVVAAILIIYSDDDSCTVTFKLNYNTEYQTVEVESGIEFMGKMDETVNDESP